MSYPLKDDLLPPANDVPVARKYVDLFPAWLLLSIAVLLVVFAGCFVWIDHNPGAIDWDNAEYVDKATLDVNAYHDADPSKHFAGIRAVANSLLFNDVARPPGFRIVVLPVTLTSGIDYLTLRLTSMLLFAVMLVGVYQSVRWTGGNSAGVLAAAIVASLVIVEQSFSIYRTETSLYPSLVGTLFFLLLGMRYERVRWPIWIALGCCLGLGGLSKITFASIAAPVLLLAFVFAIFRVLGGWRWWQVIASGVLGFAIAECFYFYDYKAVMASATEAAFFKRYMYDSWSLANLQDWLSQIGAYGFGWGMTLLVIGLFIAAIVFAVVGWRRRRELVPTGAFSEWRNLFAPTGVSLLLCLAAGLPIIAAQVVMTKTTTTRHVSPGYIALSMAACIAAGSAGVLRSRIAWLGAVVLFLVQAHTWVPEAYHARRLPWNFEPLFDAVEARDIDSPYIAELGVGTLFNPATLQYPWILHDRPVWCKWVWRYEDGDIDWAAIDKELSQAAVVVTLPGYVGDVADKQDRDNAHNAELVERLKADARFEPPRSFEVGDPSADHATMLAFFRKGVPGGWRVVSGLDHPEGPYPKLGLPQSVRWGLGPQTQLSFVTDDDRPRQVRLTGLSYANGQAIHALVDDRPIGDFTFGETGKLLPIVLPLQVAAGKHTLTLKYTTSQQDGDRAEAVLFQDIAIEPIATTQPSP